MSVTFYKGNGNHSVYELEQLVRERDEDIYQRQLEKQGLSVKCAELEEKLKELKQKLAEANATNEHNIRKYESGLDECYKQIKSLEAEKALLIVDVDNEYLKYEAIIRKIENSIAIASWNEKPEFKQWASDMKEILKNATKQLTKSTELQSNGKAGV